MSAITDKPPSAEPSVGQSTAGKQTSALAASMRILLPLILSIGFLALALRGTDLSALADSLAGVHYGWIAVVVGLIFLSSAVRAFRWGYMMPRTERKVAFRPLLSSVFIGYLVNNLLPRAGEIARVYCLTRFEPLSMSAVFGTVIAERFLDMLCMFLLLLALPFLYHGPLIEHFPWLQQGSITGVIVITAILVVIVVLVQRRESALKIIETLSRLLPSRIRPVAIRIARGFLDGLEFVRRPEAGIPMILLTGLLWFLYALMMYSGMYAFGLGETLGFDAALVMMAITTVGVVIPAPGATGTYHFFAVATLTGLYGVSRPTAMSFAVVNHAAIFLGSSLFGVIYLVLDRDKIILSSLRGMLRSRHNVAEGEAGSSTVSEQPASPSGP